MVVEKQRYSNQTTTTKQQQFIETNKKNIKKQLPTIIRRADHFK
jgi:hypothetical protein